MVNIYYDIKSSQNEFYTGLTDDKPISCNDVSIVMPNIKMDANNENWVQLNESHCGCDQWKGDCWNDSSIPRYIPLDPPLEFRDSPIESFVEKFAVKFIGSLIAEAFEMACKMTWPIPCSQVCHSMSSDLSRPPENSVLWNGLRLCWTPELFATNKHSSALSTCLSTSYNSLSTISSGNIDVSDHIKSAISHDFLMTKNISDMYNVPFDSDIYALPVDVVQRRNSGNKCPSVCREEESKSDSDYYVTSPAASSEGNSSQNGKKWRTEVKSNGFSSSGTEPIHVTVDDVRRYLKTLYASTNDVTEDRNFQDALKTLKNPFKTFQNNRNNNNNSTKDNLNNEENILNRLRSRSDYIVGGKRNENTKDVAKESVVSKIDSKEKLKKWSAIKETLCNIFRLKRLSSGNHCLGKRDLGFRSSEVGIRLSGHENQNPPSPITKPPFSKRALPPLPKLEDRHGEIIVTDSTPLPSPEEVPPPAATSLKSKESSASVDFASSIEKVKDCGWYWGPISGEAAEKILLNEPDGSFIVRDSSDDYYIFSLTFKLNSIIRHVRIEHDHGNFSFGSSTRFKSHTIVDFIESAVEHSRSGRYLFFLHRRPVLGPMRVQLLHPVSRFKQVQSLQHMCRFVILKTVRKDLIRCLPLPRRILDYLSTQHYYSENLASEGRCDSSGRDENLDEWPPESEGFS